MAERLITFKEIRFVLEGLVNELWDHGKSDNEKFNSVEKNLSILISQIQKSESQNLDNIQFLRHLCNDDPVLLARFGLL